MFSCSRSLSIQHNFYVSSAGVKSSHRAKLQHMSSYNAENEEPKGLDEKEKAEGTKEVAVERGDSYML